mmetsp:Transcript_30865/g.67544  ORF Transcript_30865/g.67544 Transcript_30865/m.67544 type:complete len:652 (+) Transcript_30865:83-2038(+)
MDANGPEEGPPGQGDHRTESKELRTGSKEKEQRSKFEQKFEDDFTQHLKKRDRLQRFRYGTLGAGLGGMVGVAASPLLIPGLAVAAVAGAAGGYQYGKNAGKKLLQRNKADPSCDVGGAGDTQAHGPSRRRLRYLVQWGTWQLLEYEDTDAELSCDVLDEVVRAFSQWVQRMYLLRARGPINENSAESREVFLHLAPLFFFLQRRAVLETVLKSTQIVEANLANCTADLKCAERCRVIFPTILETVSILDRVSATASAYIFINTFGMRRGEEAMNRAHYRLRLQRMVAAIRVVLERPGLEEALADRRALEHRSDEGQPRVPEAREETSSSSSKSPRAAKLVVPPEGVEDELVGQGEDPKEYFTASEESEEEQVEAPAHTGRTPRTMSATSRSVPERGQQAIFEQRLQAFPRGSGDHAWGNFDESTFEVRSRSYLKDRKKVASGPAMLDLVNVDFLRIGAEGPVWQVTAHNDFYPKKHWKDGDERFLFVQNWVFPPFQCIITGAVPHDAAWKHDPLSPQARVWRSFLEMGEERINRIKAIMSVEEGPWLVKRAVPKKPVLLGKKVKTETYYEPNEYLEVAFNVSSSKADEMAVSLVIRALKRLQLALAILIEAREEEELPETLLVCPTMLNLDPALLFSPCTAGEDGADTAA